MKSQGFDNKELFTLEPGSYFWARRGSKDGIPFCRIKVIGIMSVVFYIDYGQIELYYFVKGKRFNSGLYLEKPELLWE